MARDARLHDLVAEVICLLQATEGAEGPARETLLGELHAAACDLDLALDCAAGDTDDEALLGDAEQVVTAAAALCADDGGAVAAAVLAA